MEKYIHFDSNTHLRIQNVLIYGLTQGKITINTKKQNLKWWCDHYGEPSFQNVTLKYSLSSHSHLDYMSRFHLELSTSLDNPPEIQIDFGDAIYCMKGINFNLNCLYGKINVECTCVDFQEYINNTTGVIKNELTKTEKEYKRDTTAIYKRRLDL